LRRADALAGDLERVVGSPVDEPVPVLVDEGPVAMDPYVGPARPVRLDVSIGILPESVRHAGPRPCHDQLAHLTAHRLAVVAEALGGHPWDGTAEGARLDRAVGEAREDAARDLRTARVIEDGHAALADVIEEPAIGLGIPRLARRADDADRRQIVRGDPV